MRTAAGQTLPGRSASPVLIGAAFLLFAARATAEVVYLRNGDVVHGSVVGATENGITLETPYGRLVIPKRDILQIDYQDHLQQKLLLL